MRTIANSFRSLLNPRVTPKELVVPPPEDPWGSPVKWRQYLGQPSPFTITNPSWQVFANAKGVSAMSMLSLGEAAICFALARDHWTGRGEIVDLGCLMGLSTHAFALGVAQNTRVPESAKKGRASCYDLFLTSKLGPEFPLSSRTIDRGSLFDEFLAFNRDYLNLLSICPGDVLNLRWGDRPIEIAFVDLAKTMELNNWVLRSIFTCLTPGAYVIQQDLIYEQEWWVAATMEYLHPYFDIVDYCWGATGLFRLKDLSPAMLERFRERCASGLPEFDWQGWCDLLERAEERHHESARGMLRVARARMLSCFERFDDAEDLLASVANVPACKDKFRDFANIVPFAVERVRGQIAAAKGAAAA